MFGRFITSLETAPMSVAGWLAAFAGIVWVRAFLEAFSNPNNVGGYLPSGVPALLHYVLFFLGAVMITVVIVSAVTRISSFLMLRALIFVLPIMWIGPLIDIMRGGASMSYIFVATPAALINNFFTYFGPFTSVGITLGLRVEFALLILLLGAYVYVHTKRLSTALLGMFAGYSVIFSTVALPSLIGFFLPTVTGGSAWAWALHSSLIARDFLHPLETYTLARTAEVLFDVAIAQLWYLISFVAGIAWLYQVHKSAMRAMVRNLRPERMAHFVVAGVLGGLIALAGGSRIGWTFLDVVTIAVAVLTIAFAWTFAVIVNDIFDESIDTISNTERPLITGSLTREMMWDAALICGLMTLVGALTLGSYALFWIAVFSAAYYIYSAPPLRLKRVPILASAFIGIATLSIMMFGFFLISVDQSLVAFPVSIALLVILFMTLITNVRDLKDINGDAAAGIRTLPTILGDYRSRIVIGAMVFVAYVLVPILIPVPVLWIPSLIVGMASWVGLVAGRGERFVFPLYFLYLVSIVLLLRFA